LSPLTAPSMESLARSFSSTGRMKSSSIRDVFVGDESAQVVDEALERIEDDFIRPVDENDLANDSIDGAVKGLNDRFSAYFDPEEYRQFQQSASGEFSGIGVTVAETPRGLRVTEVFDDSPAKSVGIRKGDRIVAVNGKSIVGEPSEISTAKIRGKEGTKVNLTIQRGKSKRTIEVERATVAVPVVDSERRRADGQPVEVVSLSSFTDGAHGELKDAIDRALSKGAKGIVLDLRGNGGGLLDEAVLVASIFIPDGTIVTTKSRSQGTRVFEATGGAIPRDIPVVVLVDRGSASASEIVAGALKDRHRAQVVGQRTFGKGVFQEVTPLSNGGALDLTVGQYFLPSGKNIGGGEKNKRGGIPPDVLARDQPRTAADEQLQKALDVLGADLAKGS
jgi:carboxyl-terminal processing protease